MNYLRGLLQKDNADTNYYFDGCIFFIVYKEDDEHSCGFTTGVFQNQQRHMAGIDYKSWCFFFDSFSRAVDLIPIATCDQQKNDFFCENTVQMPSETCYQ